MVTKPPESFEMSQRKPKTICHLNVCWIFIHSLILHNTINSCFNLYKNVNVIQVQLNTKRNSKLYIIEKNA